MRNIYQKILRWIANEIVIQSREHRQNIIDYYKIINEAAKKEFTEDNKPTLDSFLKACYENSLEQNN